MKIKLDIWKDATTLAELPGCKKAIKEFKEDFDSIEQLYRDIVRDSYSWGEYELMQTEDDANMCHAGRAETGYDYDFFFTFWIRFVDNVARIHVCIKRCEVNEENESRSYECFVSRVQKGKVK